MYFNKWTFLFYISKSASYQLLLTLLSNSKNANQRNSPLVGLYSSREGDIGAKPCQQRHTHLLPNNRKMKLLRFDHKWQEFNSSRESQIPFCLNIHMIVGNGEQNNVICSDNVSTTINIMTLFTC